MGEPFETKVAVVLLEELAVWQKANAAAFLVTGIAGSRPELVGEAYVDGSGDRYLPMLRQPVLIYASIFTRELFSTANDAANRAAVAAVPAGELDLVAIALRADRKIVDKVLDKLRPHS